MKSAAWTRKEGQNPKGGLNAKGRASYKAQTGGTLKAPGKKSAKTQKRFLPGTDGIDKGAAYERRQKDTIKIIIRGMGSPW